MLQLKDILYDYPDISDPDLQIKLFRKPEYFNTLPTNKIDPKIKPGSGLYFEQQIIIQRILQQYDRLLLRHQAGTGKSCTVFLSAETFKSQFQNIDVTAPQIKHVYVVSRGKNLLQDQRNQLVRICTTGQYLPRRGLSPGQRIRYINRVLKKYYTFVTYNRFAKMIGNSDVKTLKKKYNNCFFFVDEVHNISVRDVDQLLVLLSYYRNEWFNYGKKSLHPGKSWSQVNRQALRIIKEQEFDKRNFENQPNGIMEYLRMWKLFHSVLGSKVILPTATPMIDKPSELISIINLLLPIENQMNVLDPLKLDLPKFNKYLSGYVSFLDNARAKVVLKSVGKVLTDADSKPLKIKLVREVVKPFGKEQEEFLSETDTKIYPVEMSEMQAESYINILKKSKSAAEEIDEAEFNNSLGQAFHFPERSVSNIVFPDGSVGNAAYKRYQKKAEFIEYLEDLDKLKTIAPKYVAAYEITQQKGVHWIYSDLKEVGVMVLAQMFEAQGYIWYQPTEDPFYVSKGEEKLNLTKRKRVAVIIPELSKSSFDIIDKILKSEANIDGEYISVVIGSQAAREGISIYNVRTIQIIEPGWNPSDLLQATYRAVRVVSHQYLLKRKIKRLIKTGLTEEEATQIADVKVLFYKHVAVLPKKYLRIAKKISKDFIEINKLMYLRIEQKDIDIKKVERWLNQVSIDCIINYIRNHKRNNKDYSPTCDYQECDYKCFGLINHPQKMIDYIGIELEKLKSQRNDSSAYYNLDIYLEQSYRDNKALIKLLFKTVFELSLAQIYYRFGQEPRLINYTLSRMIREKEPVENRFGVVNYLQMYQNRVFLTEDPFSFEIIKNNYKSLPSKGDIIESLPPLVDGSSTGYSKIVVSEKKGLLNNYKNQIKQQEILKKINKVKNISQLEEVLIELSADNIIKFFETAIVKKIKKKKLTEGEDLFLNLANRYRWFYQIPVQKTLTQQILKKSSVEGKMKIFISKKMSLEKLNEIPFDSKGDQYVIVHNIYSKVSAGTLTSYGSGSEMFRVSGILRMMSLAEDEFHNVSQLEDTVYRMVMTKLKGEEIFKFYQKYKNRSFGVFYHGFGKPTEFRIIDLTGVNAIKRVKKKSLDVRKIPEGKRCSSYNNADLINLIFNWKIKWSEIAELLDLDYEEIMDDVKKMRKKIQKYSLNEKKKLLLASKFKFRKYHIENIDEKNIDYGLVWSYQLVKGKLISRKILDENKVTSDLFCLLLRNYFVKHDIIYHYA